MVVDARGIQARPAMFPRIFDEDSKEVYDSVNVDLEYAIKNGMSGYARDLTMAQANQRVIGNPITVKAVRTSGPGKSDIIINNADAQKIRLSAESATFLKTVQSNNCFGLILFHLEFQEKLASTFP